MSRATERSMRNEHEAGHLIVGLMVMVTVMMILLTAAAQSWTFLTRRDNEAELIFRGEQYANAIAFYQKENGQYPLDLKILMQRGPHRHRYIRRLWKDPVSKDGKWGKLYLSPNGKGFINPYASRRDQQAFVAGSFGDAGPGGGAFEDDEAADDGTSGSTSSRGGFKSRLGGGSTSRMNRGARGAFGRNDEGQETAGYSEPIPEGMDLRGGDAVGLPIVGVVHRKRESGVKTYKNQAYLNDWAFTALAEGQDLRMGGSIVPPKAPTRNFGMGDSHSPVYLKGDEPPGTGAAPKKQDDPLTKFHKRRQEQQRAYAEEERRRKAEEEAKRRQEEGEGQDQDESDPTEDDDQDDTGDEAPPEDEQDPNAPNPNDPNAPADPNASPSGYDPGAVVLEAPSPLVL